MNGGSMGRLSTEVDFSRSGTAQSLMRSQVSVVIKPELESAFKFPFGQRLERTQSQGVFDGSPTSFDDRDGAVAADGTEALPGAEPESGFLKPLGRELPSLVGDEVSGWAETKRGPLEQPAHLSGGGFFPEDFGGERVRAQWELEPRI